MLAAAPARAGDRLLLTREPGGTEGAEAIRELIVEGPAERWRPLAELYLFLAAREDHLAPRHPAGDCGRGAWVLCDRFADSSRVYQGIAGGLGLDLVDGLQAPLLGAPPRPHAGPRPSGRGGPGALRSSAAAPPLRGQGRGLPRARTRGVPSAGAPGARALRRDRRQSGAEDEVGGRGLAAPCRAAGACRRRDRPAGQPASVRPRGCRGDIMSRAGAAAACRTPGCCAVHPVSARRRWPTASRAGCWQAPTMRWPASDPAHADVPAWWRTARIPTCRCSSASPIPKTGKLYREILVDQVRTLERSCTRLRHAAAIRCSIVDSADELSPTAPTRC